LGSGIGAFAEGLGAARRTCDAEVNELTRRELVVTLAGLLLAACASVPAPATRSPQNPAHPGAPEAVTPPADPVLMTGDDAAPQPVPAPPKIEMDMTAGYTCPMHPEVKADKPGSCPVCGMALVEKKPARPGGGGSR